MSEEQKENQEKNTDEKESEQTNEPIERSSFQRRGCLAGCLPPLFVVLAVLFIILISIYIKQNSIQNTLLRRIIANTQNQVIDILPEDMDKNEVNTVFENVKIAIREGYVDKKMLTETIMEYQENINDDLPIEKKNQLIEKLLNGLEASISKKE